VIDSIDISVIMQGPVYGNKNDIEEKQITKRCCIRVKELLPKCELILSTWEDTDTSNIDVDKIIFNKEIVCQRSEYCSPVELSILFKILILIK